MYKDYKNPKLEAYFQKYISTMSIDKKFQPYIVDILLRRAYQYNLSPEEIRNDVKALNSSLKKFKVVSPKILGSSSINAAYYPFFKTIKINKNMLKGFNSPEILYETFAHELFHALSRDPKTGKDKLSGNANRYSGKYNSSLLETIVEKSSYKIVFGTKQNNAYYNNNSYGYNDMTFILDAIEAVYGVNEQALLKNSIQSRNQTATFLSNSIKENKDDTLDFLDQIEMAFSRLHTTLYTKEGEKLSPEKMANELQISLCDMKRVCEQKLSDRIENLSFNQIDEIDNIAFDYNKLNAIFTERCNYFDTYMSYGKDFQTNITQHMNSNKFLNNDTKKALIKIKDIRQINEKKDSIDPKLAERLFTWGKYGNLNKYNNYLIRSKQANPTFLEDIGLTAYNDDVDINEDLFESNKPLFQKIANERMDPEMFTDQWDNKGISLALKKDLNELRYKNFFTGISDKFKNIFNKFKNKNQLQLPSGISSTPEKKDTLREDLKVSNEMLMENSEKKESKVPENEKNTNIDCVDFDER